MCFKPFTSVPWVLVPPLPNLVIKCLAAHPFADHLVLKYAGARCCGRCWVLLKSLASLPQSVVLVEPPLLRCPSSEAYKKDQSPGCRGLVASAPCWPQVVGARKFAKVPATELQDASARLLPDASQDTRPPAGCRPPSLSCASLRQARLLDSDGRPAGKQQCCGKAACETTVLRRSGLKSRVCGNSSRAAKRPEIARLRIRQCCGRSG